MANLSGFDANTVENVSFEPIPAGRYIAVITESEMKKTKDNSGKYLELKFEVIEGEYKGRNVWARLNLENQNDLTVKIGKSELAAVCKAIGVLTPHDSSELHNLPLEIAVKLKKRSDNDENTNEIKGYHKRQLIPSATTSPAKGGIAPWKR